MSFRSLGAHSRYCTMLDPQSENIGEDEEDNEDDEDKVSKDDSVEGDGVEENKDMSVDESVDGAAVSSTADMGEQALKRRKYSSANDDKQRLYPKLDGESWNEIWLANFCIRHELSQEAAQELVDWVKQVRSISEYNYYIIFTKRPGYLNFW